MTLEKLSEIDFIEEKTRNFSEEAKEQAEKAGRHLEILGYVLGTELDVQNSQEQTQKLMDAGVTISSSSQNTGLLAREFVLKGDSK